MKTLKNLIISIAVVSLLFSLVISKTHKNKNHKGHKSHHKLHKHTPKAIDLSNHFGAPEIGSPYGPTTSYEDFVERNPEVFTPQRFTGWKAVQKEMQFKPYPGWEDKLNPHFIKSGEFTNVAPAASKVIQPEITGPKLHVQAEVNYNAQVKMPTFYGFKKEYMPVTAYDKEDGRIVHDKVLVNKPQYGYEDKVNLNNL